MVALGEGDGVRGGDNVDEVESGDREPSIVTSGNGSASNLAVMGSNSSGSSGENPRIQLQSGAPSDVEEPGARNRVPVETLVRLLGWNGKSQDIAAVAAHVEYDHSLNFGLQAANEWGKAYMAAVAPEWTLASIAARDTAEMYLAGNVWDLARLRQRQRADSSLSAARVDKVCGPIERCGAISSVGDVVGSFEEFRRDSDILREFGERGVEIITCTSFTPRCDAGRLSESYRAAPWAVLAHIHKARLAGNGILLSKACADSILNRNEICSGIALKKGKASGRLTSNGSGNSARRGGYLNSEEVKIMAEERWGAIKHPTLASIIEMVLGAEEKWGRDSVVVWKTDLKGAFSLLKFRPDDIHLMTTRVESGEILVYTQGNFGWACMGFAFQVVTRVIIALVRTVVRFATMYCDDLIAAGEVSSWEGDRTACVAIMTNLLGEEAEERAKRESTADNVDREVTTLGWSIILSMWTVDIADYNRVKAMHLFAAVEASDFIMRHEMEAVISLAFRYSQVYPELGVLTGDLNAMNNGWSRRHKRTKLSEPARSAIRLWLAYLSWSQLRVTECGQRGRCLSTFRRCARSVIVEFDGSLTGVGIRLMTPDGFVITAIGIIAKFDLQGDSQFQNCMEFAAYACGCLLAGLLGFQGQTIHPRGDSMTVLEWVTGGRPDFKSVRSKGPSILYVGTCRAFDIRSDDSFSHIEGATENVVCDALSRGNTPSPGTCGESGHVWASPESIMGKALALCNPLTVPVDELGFLSRWRDVESLIRSEYPVV